MSKLYANPYNFSAKGFYFDSHASYVEQSENLQDEYGNLVEEFEIDFIDGDLPCLFKACEINQCTLELWFDRIETLNESEQAELYYRCEFLSQSAEEALDNLNQDGSLSQSTLIDYSHECIDESGELEKLPEHLQRYFDYAAYANDLVLGGDVVEFDYQSEPYIASGF